MYIPDSVKTSRVLPIAEGAFFSSNKDINILATSNLVILPTAISPWLNNGLKTKKNVKQI
jgi:hypothetical protein